MLRSVYALPSPSCFADCAYRVLSIPPRSPKGLSPTASARVAPASRLRALQLNTTRRGHRANTEALFRSPRLTAHSLCEIQAAKPLPDQSHARRADATGTRSCSASPRALSLVSSKSTGDLPFSIRRRDCTYAVQGLLARASLRSTLSRCGLISLGFSKK